MLVKSNMFYESSVAMYMKAIYVAALGTSLLMYVWVKKRLSNKLSNKSLSITISRLYYYVYLGAVVFVSRFVMAYILKDNVVSIVNPGFNVGLGSYVNYGLAQIIKNQMYANVIINTILAFISCVVIKKILLNIMANDTVATVASLIYLFIPQSLVYVTEYIKYSYNVLFVLVGILLIIKIIDEVKNFSRKNKMYLLYALILGVVASADIVLGGSYVFWSCLLIITTIATLYVDTTHIRIKCKNNLSYKLKRIAEKIEKINISKLIHVAIIVLLIAGITTVAYEKISSANNYKIFNVENSINILNNSRTYYIALLVFGLVFEIIGLLLKRKLDAKMLQVKMTYIIVGILTFFMVDGIYASALFDTFLSLTVIINICNICYNREEKIKLLKAKN